MSIEAGDEGRPSVTEAAGGEAAAGPRIDGAAASSAAGATAAGQGPRRAPDGRPAFTGPRERHGLIGPFTALQLLAAVAIVAVVGVLLLLVTTPLAAGPASTTRPLPAPTQFVVGAATEGLRVGDRAPELEARRADGSLFHLTDLAGHPVRLADLRGHPVWIDFWASWCPPCQEETPVLRDIYNSYRDRGLVLVAISVQESSAADVAAYARKYDLPYTVAADLSGDIFRLYRIYGLPTQFFLDGDGVIRSVVQGPVDYDLAVANLQGIVPSASGSRAKPSPSAK